MNAAARNGSPSFSRRSTSEVRKAGSPMLKQKSQRASKAFASRGAKAVASITAAACERSQARSACASSSVTSAPSRAVRVWP